ncbi:(START) domain containing 8 [Kappamyces sp. JEL0829]|nr:(START) domain containing 8 [Kappamyces sp. JEL0829]
MARVTTESDCPGVIEASLIPLLQSSAAIPRTEFDLATELIRMAADQSTSAGDSADNELESTASDQSGQMCAAKADGSQPTKLLEAAGCHEPLLTTDSSEELETIIASEADAVLEAVPDRIPDAIHDDATFQIHVEIVGEINKIFRNNRLPPIPPHFFKDAYASMHGHKTPLRWLSALFARKRDHAANTPLCETTIRVICDKTAQAATESGDRVPMIVAKLTTAIREQGTFLALTVASALGIFRVSGSQQRISQILRPFNEPDYGASCLYDAADALKKFFRNLREPLLTTELHSYFVSSLHIALERDKIRAFQLLILLLPKENISTLGYLLAFLADIAAVETNKMPAPNLGKVFAPNLMRSGSRSESVEDYNDCAKVLTYFIEGASCFQMKHVPVSHILAPPENTTRKTRKKSVLRQTSLSVSHTKTATTDGAGSVRRKSVHFNLAT